MSERREYTPYDAWALAGATVGIRQIPTREQIERCTPWVRDALLAVVGEPDRLTRLRTLEESIPPRDDGPPDIWRAADSAPFDPPDPTAESRPLEAPGDDDDDDEIDPESVELATCADINQCRDAGYWAWTGWIPRSSITGIAAHAGVGKTRLTLDLCRRVWLGLPWPDGRPATYPTETPTVWVAADGHQDELRQALIDMGLPLHAIIFPAPRSSPYSGDSLDEELTWEFIAAACKRHKPAFVVVDSLSYATTLDLCSQQAIASLKKPARRIVKEHGVPFVLLMHLSKDGKVFGRRITGLTRTSIQIEATDPSDLSRLRLWVEKSFDRKPEALGIESGAKSLTYTDDPPPPADQSRGGRPATQSQLAKSFIIGALRERNDRSMAELATECERKTGASENTTWRTAKKLQDIGRITLVGGRGTGQQTIAHLNSVNPGDPIIPPPDTADGNGPAS